MGSRPERPPYLRGRSERAAPGAGGASDLKSSGLRTFTVGELTGKIAGMFARVGPIGVEGEVSRISRAASGHVYFDLKDAAAKLACVVWKSQVERAIRFDLKEGTQVLARGTIDVYAPRGSYSLIVDRLEPAGLGALLARFEELKRELGERGWFERRRPLPRLPRRVGVVTSRDGAAFQDFLRTRSLRWPGYPLRLAHSPVQGPGAAEAIADAIDRLVASGVDVVVVCRGGGSLEDLWAFNERPVAEAIWRASVPVVSGIGHETDVTLADLVSDHRAHTPTDAAQTVVPERAELDRALERAQALLAQAIDGRLQRLSERLERARRARVLRDPSWILGDRSRSLELARERLGRGLEGRLGRAAARLDATEKRLERRGPRELLFRAEQRLAAGERGLHERGARTLERADRRVALAATRLEALSPLRVLARGFSMTSRAGSTRPIQRAGDVGVGDLLETRLSEGRIRSRVEEVDEPEDA